MEITQNAKDRIGMYAAIVKQLTPMVEDVYGVAILHEIGKDLRCDRIMESRNAVFSGDNENQPATQKQIDYLKSLDVDIPKETTKKQASQLIDEAIEVSK